jgi:hypothetical protein
MLNIEQYVRKPFYVEAVVVTAENMAEVAKWCGGEVLTEKQGRRTVKYIKVPVARPMSEKQTKAFLKDRVLKADTGFKVYTEDAFNKCFDLTEKKPEFKGQEPLFAIVDEVSEVFKPREVCGMTKYTIDHKPCILDKDHGKRPCTSIEIGPARTDNQVFASNFPKNYPKPSSR